MSPPPCLLAAATSIPHDPAAGAAILIGLLVAFAWGACDEWRRDR